MITIFPFTLAQPIWTSSTECLADLDGDGYGALVEQCYILDLVDTNQYWDEAEIIATVNGIEVDAWTNLGGGIETYTWCYDSGSLELSYSCSSSYGLRKSKLLFIR